MEEEQLENIVEHVRDAVNHIAPIMNTLSFTKGYTPMQWVLNSNPRDPTSVTADDFNPVAHHDALTDPDFEDELRRRASARVAFMKADADAKLRRALLRRHRAMRMPLVVGQKCYFGGPPEPRDYRRIYGEVPP